MQSRCPCEGMGKRNLVNHCVLQQLDTVDELYIKQHQKIYSVYHLCPLRHMQENNSVLIKTLFKYNRMLMKEE